MERISDGYYYEVFDLGNGKVLKRKKAFKEIAEAVAGKSNMSFLVSFYKAWKHIRDCERVTKTVIQKKKVPAELLGNPRFINETDFEQDKVTLLVDYLSSHSLEENKAIIDKYIDLVRVFLRYGVHDYVYKFKNSYGINKDNELVCIDFNEMVFSKNQVLEFAQKEEWRIQAQFTKFKEGQLKDYLGSKLKELLVPSVIESLWGTGI